MQLGAWQKGGAVGGAAGGGAAAGKELLDQLKNKKLAYQELLEQELLN